MTWHSRSSAGVWASCTSLVVAIMWSIWLPIFIANSSTVMFPIGVAGVMELGWLVKTSQTIGVLIFLVLTGCSIVAGEVTVGSLLRSIILLLPVFVLNAFECFGHLSELLQSPLWGYHNATIYPRKLYDWIYYLSLTLKHVALLGQLFWHCLAPCWCDGLWPWL